ncbi:CHASE2 domain-containing protein [Leptolyngbya sp. UWPOB_LEPTO1]|uniref:CHASE2 domain-containing protein n=1 Tax=Leptolyngbya sp. UWPOB_LEPTO1 TaxID=2815653 RepID=UPI00257E1D64|nr:CHASE2 domain-containing protein [Leptolyngbya sp. UWPOB_LEPTO1]
MRWLFNNLRRLRSGLISIVLILTLSWLGVLQPLENLAYQVLFLVRGEQSWDSRIVIVEIDDRSLAELGRFPWKRDRFAQLLNVLARAEENIVAFDIIWSEPSAEDLKLADAIAQHQAVVLATAQDNLGVPLLPVDSLRSQASAMGHIRKQIDADGISRSIPASPPDRPSFAIATLERYFMMGKDVTLPPPNQPLWLNWSRASQHIPSYSFVDVMRDRVPIQAFENKIILVGMTATGYDELITPFNRAPPTSGVYLHATAINNVLQHKLLQPVPKSWSFGVLMFFGLGLSRWLDRWQTMTQVWIGLGLVIFWFGYCVLALKFGSVWFSVATPILFVLAVVSITILQERLSLNAMLQRQVQELWNRYYSDIVLRQVDESLLVSPQLSQQPVSMRRVQQLATLAEQFGRSHAAQAAIARNLSIGLLAADLDGFIWFCNPAAATWLNVKVGMLLQSQLVPNWITPHQWQEKVQQLAPFEVERSQRWFELKFEPLFYQPQDQSPSGLLLILEEITDRKQTAIALQDYADTQTQLNQRLTEINQELEAFSFAVSHDLRAPLRRIKSFSDMLLEDHVTQLEGEAKSYLNYIQASVQRMGDLIEDLLKLSRIIRLDMQVEQVDLSQIASAIAQDLKQTQPNRQVEVTIQADLTAYGDARLLRVALENLLGNAWKYTSRRAIAEIEFGVMPKAPVFFVRDNGAGFDMAQSGCLFNAFQRLHAYEDFPGNGIGLMTVRRIIQRHQGQIWVDSEVDRGTTFYFTTLPPNS